LESSQSAKSVKNCASTGALQPGEGLWSCSCEAREKQGGNYRDKVSFNGLPEDPHSSSLYNPLTAADEKIPLPVVHVNNKPQYLVFG
jgi:hypothetical protein